MGDETFNETILTEKLSKLNSSQQSIESLSRWCVSNRKNAKQVVETWEKLFKSAQRDQRVSFLYLSNDILQNSRRKGSEFVNEFWKVLPTSLKLVYDSGNENSRKVASRLVDIWEERKVFGSSGQNLKNAVLGKISTPVNNVKNSNPIKVVKRDANSLRIKLAVGGLPEKIITALQSVHDEVVNEEAALNKCRNAVSSMQEIEKDVVNAFSQGNVHGSSDVVDNIQKQENLIQQSISRLENSEAIRVALVSQLREALEDQESKLEQIGSELLVARGQINKAASIRLLLTSPSSLPPPTNQLTESTQKAAAAAVAAKLAASTCSAQMLTSILSSLVAEEAASMTTGLKRPKLDHFPTPQQEMTNLPPVGSGQLQTPFLPPPPPPPQLRLQPSGYGVGPTGFSMVGPPPPQQVQQQSGSGGYFGAVGIGFYGQSHQLPTPPIHRQ